MLWEGNGSKREQMRRDIQRKISQINMERRELERQDADDRIQQRGLARTVGADDGDDLARADCERQGRSLRS